jgi:hypothetical protein
MCAVCWTGAQIIPVTAVAARYIWVNHLQGRRAAGRAPEPADDAERRTEEVAERAGV